jgi:hypothetical protein
MSHVKGLVLLSRFEYLDFKQGTGELKKLVKKTSTDEANFVRQPVDGANLYPEEILVRVDEALLADHFDNNLEEFFILGQWNARNNLAKYFGLYMDEGGPKAFLDQFARLRESLIGSGEMTISESSNDKLLVVIEYEQPVPKSVCLSEQGFMSEGLVLCGAKNLKIKELVSAGDGKSNQTKLEVTFSLND